MYLKKITDHLLPTRRSKIFFIIIAGILVGGGTLFMYVLRAHTYLGDDPSACMNCHIMSPQYASWFHSSHGLNTTCNDCHVPHDNALRKWMFKGGDGLRHLSVYLVDGEDQVIQAIPASSQVIMDNCIRCHTQLNTEFVKAGRIDYMSARAGQGKACWDCHRDVPHGSSSSLSSTSNALVPHPDSPEPQWLKNLINRKK